MMIEVNLVVNQYLTYSKIKILSRNLYIKLFRVKINLKNLQGVVIFSAYVEIKPLIAKALLCHLNFQVRQSIWTFLLKPVYRKHTIVEEYYETEIFI